MDWEEWYGRQDIKTRIQQAEKTVGKWAGQCVPFARRYSNIQIRGNAWNLTPTQSAPAIEGLVLYRAHVGVVLDIDGDKILVYDSNRHGNERIALTWDTIHNPAIRGYIHPL